MQRHYGLYQQQMPPQIAQSQRNIQQQQAYQTEQQHNIQQQQAYQTEQVRRLKSRNSTDKNLPDGVEGCVVDPEIVRRYRRLREVERRMDMTTTRKRLDVMDILNRNAKLYKTMRIWITNTVEDQVWQGSGDLNVDAFDFSPNVEASYRVKIEGRLLDDEEETYKPENDKAQDGDNVEEDGPETDKAKRASSHCFSHFFKAISVQFDNSAEQAIEWKRPEPNAQTQDGGNAAADFDKFTFKRNGDKNTNIAINLHRFEVPERYSLSRELTEVIDMEEGTLDEVVMGLWEYIRLNGLQKDDNQQKFRCDELLKKVIAPVDVADIPKLSEYVKYHLAPVLISLPYTIRVDEEFHTEPQPAIYDVPILVDDPMRATLQSLVANPHYASMLQDINELDGQLDHLVQALYVSQAKHSFFRTLSEDPVNFIRTWLSSQKRDLDIVFGETARSGAAVAGDEWRKGGKDSIWTTSNARESVGVILSSLG